MPFASFEVADLLAIFKLKVKHHLEWDALDGEPVDILFFLISSPRQGDGADHASDCGMAAVRPGAGQAHLHQLRLS